MTLLYAKLIRHGLTGRQAQVVVGVYRGYTNQEIGDIICVSSDTVKAHLTYAYGKLGLAECGYKQKRTELILKCKYLLENDL